MQLRIPCSLAVLLTTASAIAAPTERAGNLVAGQPDVWDGDTMKIGNDLLRLNGLDVPEMDDPRGPRSRAGLEKIIRGQMIFCEILEKDRDRWVSVCWLDQPNGRDLAEIMLEQGWGFHWRKYTDTYPERATRYDAAERRARDHILKPGFWDDGTLIGINKGILISGLLSAFIAVGAGVYLQTRDSRLKAANVAYTLLHYMDDVDFPFWWGKRKIDIGTITTDAALLSAKHAHRPRKAIEELQLINPSLHSKLRTLEITLDRVPESLKKGFAEYPYDLTERQVYMLLHRIRPELRAMAARQNLLSSITLNPAFSFQSLMVEVVARIAPSVVIGADTLAKGLTKVIADFYKSRQGDRKSAPEKNS